MRKATWLALTAAMLAGCTLQDENPDWAPKQDLPGWTYDAPFYYRPTEELKVSEIVGDGIPVYYSRLKGVFIRHPGGYQVGASPRICVMSSVDEGENWCKEGYYGVEQSHFLMQAENDGRYWIRFVGPGQGVTKVPPGMPHRIYVVDTTPPNVMIDISPEPWKDKEKTEPYVYKPGEEVTIYWSVRDANLAADTIKLQTCFARFPNNLVWSEFPTAMPAQGERKITIPDEAVQDGGLRFRVEATDKAGNVGFGITPILQIEGAASVEEQQAVRQAADFELIQQTGGTPGKKLGWPMRSELIRGGAKRTLGWMPDAAAEYDLVKVQFSPNNGQTWRTVAESRLADRKDKGTIVEWMVPTVTSKDCRLRIVGVVAGERGEEHIMLATTQRFTVDTVDPDTIIGPEKIKEKESILDSGENADETPVKAEEAAEETEVEEKAAEEETEESAGEEAEPEIKEPDAPSETEEPAATQPETDEVTEPADDTTQPAEDKSGDDNKKKDLKELEDVL